MQTIKIDLLVTPADLMDPIEVTKALTPDVGGDSIAICRNNKQRTQLTYKDRWYSAGESAVRKISSYAGKL